MTEQNELVKALWDATAEDLTVIARNPTLASPAIANMSEETLDRLIELKQTAAQQEQIIAESNVRDSGQSFEQAIEAVDAATAEVQEVKERAEAERRSAYARSPDEDDARFEESLINQDEEESIESIYAGSPLAGEMASQRLEEVTEEMEAIISKAVKP